MIVITCASGHQASSFIPLLVSRNLGSLRLIVNSEPSETRLKSQYSSSSGSIEVVRGDLADPYFCAKIVQDASTVYHIGPSFHPHETEVGYNMVDAALAESKRPGSQFMHFIYSSVIQTQLGKLLNHDCKRYVEEYLMESGLNWTILKPTTFLDNFTPALQNLVKKADEGKNQLTFTAPWNADVLFSEIARKDFGEVSLKVIAERESHYFASYDLCSTVPQPWRAKVDVLARELGCEIKVSKGDFEKVVPVFTKPLLGKSESGKDHDSKIIIGAERMILYYNRCGIMGSPKILEMLLGRKATTTEDWVKQQVAEASAGMNLI